MLAQSTIDAAADRAVMRMLAGERVIVSEDTLDAITIGPNGRDDVCTYVNANRVGLLDAYVAWIGDNAPRCLRHDADGHGYSTTERQPCPIAD